MIITGLDLETTGLLEPEHRIIECHISKYDFDGATPVLINERTWRIDPKRSIDAKARAVHGISETDLIGKPTFEDVGHEIAAALADTDLGVAHNGNGYDWPFLIKEFERVGVDIPDFHPFDTMEEGRWACPLGKAPNLQELCWASGIQYDPAKAHAADYDVRRMMECFFFGVRRGVFVMPSELLAQQLN